MMPPGGYGCQTTCGGGNTSYGCGLGMAPLPLGVVPPLPLLPNSVGAWGGGTMVGGMGGGWSPGGPRGPGAPGAMGGMGGMGEGDWYGWGAGGGGYPQQHHHHHRRPRHFPRMDGVGGAESSSGGSDEAMTRWKRRSDEANGEVLREAAKKRSLDLEQRLGSGGGVGLAAKEDEEGAAGAEGGLVKKKTKKRRRRAKERKSAAQRAAGRKLAKRVLAEIGYSVHRLVDGGHAVQTWVNEKTKATTTVDPLSLPEHAESKARFEALKGVLDAERKAGPKAAKAKLEIPLEIPHVDDHDAHIEWASVMAQLVDDASAEAPSKAALIAALQENPHTDDAFLKAHNIHPDSKEKVAIKSLALALRAFGTKVEGAKVDAREDRAAASSKLEAKDAGDEDAVEGSNMGDEVGKMSAKAVVSSPPSEAATCSSELAIGAAKAANTDTDTDSAFAAVQLALSQLTENGTTGQRPAAPAALATHTSGFPAPSSSSSSSSSSHLSSSVELALTASVTSMAPEKLVNPEGKKRAEKGGEKAGAESQDKNDDDTLAGPTDKPVIVTKASGEKADHDKGEDEGGLTGQGEDVDEYGYGLTDQGEDEDGLLTDQGEDDQWPEHYSQLPVGSTAKSSKGKAKAAKQTPQGRCWVCSCGKQQFVKSKKKKRWLNAKCVSCGVRRASLQISSGATIAACRLVVPAQRSLAPPTTTVPPGFGGRGGKGGRPINAPCRFMMGDQGCSKGAQCR